MLGQIHTKEIVEARDGSREIGNLGMVEPQRKNRQRYDLWKRRFEVKIRTTGIEEKMEYELKRWDQLIRCKNEAERG